jgi:threonine dehydrogenase-like Zn-dependent dehydrogenase
MIRAASLRGPRRLELDPVGLPPPRPDDVLVRVVACGVCATNLHDWAHPDRAMRGSELPGAHGHEVSGVVASVGEAVEGVAPGDRVCLDPGLACACGVCEPCLAGRPRSCRNRSTLPVWGFADAIVVPARGVVQIPAGLDLEVACLAEPLASAVHGIRHGWSAATDGRIEGLRVAVVGAGAMGLCAVLAARRLGAAEVIVVARHEHQARVAAALGADRVLDDDAGTGSVLRRLRPHLVVEAAGGNGSAFETACAAVEDGGEVVVLGLPDGHAALDVPRLVLRNVHAFFAAAYGVRDGRSDFSIALAILAETAAAAQLITHRFPLDDVGDAFRAAAWRTGGSLRVVVSGSYLPNV